MRYELVLFDFDGTLADSLALANGLFERLSDRFHLRKLTPSQHEELRDRGPGEIMAALDIPLWKMPRIISAFRKSMAQEIRSVPLFEGTGAMLRQLKSRAIQIGVVSSNSESNILHVLGPDLCSVISYLECGVSLFGKAARLRRATKRAGVSPDHCLYVGDEIRDLEAAHTAGMAFGGVAWGLTRPMAFRDRGCQMLFRTMADLAERLS